MTQFHTLTPAATRARAIAAARDEQQSLMRGVVHGILLSMIIWIAAGYLTFILH